MQRNVHAGAPGPVERVVTRHADEFRAWIASRYTDHERRVRLAARGFGFAAEHVASSGLTYLQTRYAGVTVDIDCPPTALFSVTHFYAGRAVVRWAGGEAGVREHGTLLLPPPYFSTALIDGSHTGSVGLSGEVLLRVAEEVAGLERSHVRLTGLTPVSAAAERQWLSTADYVRRGLCARAFDHPLLLAAAQQLVGATLLATFPNTTMTADLRGPRDPASPAVVRRAAEFVDANAGRPITLTDIAAAAGVVPRTLQYAFRRHRNTTPMDYLRRVRLARAHDDLRAAQPGDGVTVAGVAARWGFARPHRFAAAYRAAYGSSPAETLRS